MDNKVFVGNPWASFTHKSAPGTYEDNKLNGYPRNGYNFNLIIAMKGIRYSSKHTDIEYQLRLLSDRSIDVKFFFFLLYILICILCKLFAKYLKK